MNNITIINNWINGQETEPQEPKWLEKFNPHSGQLLSYVADSSFEDVNAAIISANNAFSAWFELTPVKRGQILSDIVNKMKHCIDELVDCIALEAGKPPQDARAEVNAAILQGEFFAGEGMRLYGRSLTSSINGKSSYTVREPRGIAGLIVPANTPIANIAWKTFPALICGNTVVMKAAEDTPHIALLFARLSKEAGLPDGVFNVIQGSGVKAGAALVEDKRVSIISFTGSTTVGRHIAEIAGRRLARVSLELGGKNSLVVCDDADLDQAVHWALLSSFSNAGQRCASGSRILLFKDIYQDFRDRFVARARCLKLGVDEGCDLGPVINKRQHQAILVSIERAKLEGGTVLCGGDASAEEALLNGYYVNPTIIEGLPSTAQLSNEEIFGPVVILHKVNDLMDAAVIANSTEYGLTSAIHTRSIDRAMWFAKHVKTGVVNVNSGTFGSEPHMPFGGYGASGNGTREPGLEALDVYSELKTISLNVRNDKL